MSINFAVVSFQIFRNSSSDLAQGSFRNSMALHQLCLNLDIWFVPECLSYSNNKGKITLHLVPI